MSIYESECIVWVFKFKFWITDKSIKVADYNITDYRLWAEKGTEGLKQSIPEREFDWVKKH